MWPRPKCTECGKEFNPWRERPFGLDAATCGSAECQRKRKTRLQRERRAEARKLHDASLRSNYLQDVASFRSSRAKQRGSTLPLKQRRSRLPQLKGMSA